MPFDAFAYGEGYQMSRTEIEPAKSLDAKTLEKTIPTANSSVTLYDKCLALAHNLWWSWHLEVVNLFRDLDPIRWRQLDHNPIAQGPQFHRSLPRRGKSCFRWKR